MTQKVINERIFEVAPRAFGPPVQCDKCGAQELHKTFSFQRWRGRLYVHEFSQAGFDSSEALKLCDACWPTWLMWRAREGWDLHFHRIDDQCEHDCLARQGGRKLQFQSQMNLFRNTSDQFFLAKGFDGQPTKNGSPLLMSCRLNHFLFRPFTKQAYYESIGDVDELLRQILLNAQLNQIGIPHGATDSFLLVFEVFEGAHHAPGGVITEPKQSERTLGLHCVCQTGYRDGGETLTFVNNWGRGWGKKGFGSVSVDYLRRHFYEAYVVRPAQFGLMPWKLQNVAPESLTSRRLREIHMVVNPRGGERRIMSNGETWRFEFYQTLSPTTDAPVECISIQTNFGLRMGWAFLRHTWAGKPEPRVTEILELFVMPAFRRMGVGRELEHRAVEQAHVWQSSEIHLILNEADSVVGPPRHSARNYALALGYQWRIHNKVAPRRTGTAIKKLQTVDPVTKPITP